MSFCTNCGSKLPRSALFCTKCGQKIAIDGLSPQKSWEPVSTNPPASSKQSNLKKYLAAIGLLILLVANPNQTDFEIFLNGQINQKYPNGQEQDDFFGNLLKGVVKTYASEYLKQSTNRQNFLIFSVYTVNLTGLQNFATNLPSSAKFIGILGNFIPLTDTNISN
jgi:hypothetical protein